VRILILGSSGYLGKTLYYYLKTKKHLVFHTGILKKKFDLTEIQNLKKIISKTKPNLIVNCLGLTNIDVCEIKSSLSKKINVNTVKNIFELKNKYNYNFKLLHMSTDQIYNPRKNIKNKENSNFKAVNVYTKHKLSAEKICLKNFSIIFRTNLIGKSFSKKKSFTDWIYNNLSVGRTINAFDDSYYSPLSVRTISQIINKIINKKKLDESGLFNLGSTDGISKSSLIKKFSEELNIFDEKLIVKEKINNICKTTRTKNNRLCIKKFEKHFKIKLPKIFTEIKKIVKDYE